MKALYCSSYGKIEDLTYGEISNPEVAPDEVMIQVRYSGVNFPDTLIVEGKYQFKPDLPFAPGGEVAGTIERVGAEVKELKKGDTVIAAMGWGGFSEYAVAKASNTYVFPESGNLKKGAVLLETYGTALYGLKNRGALDKGETLLVLGASGGTGQAAIQIGKVLGAKIIAIASSEGKRALAKENGADIVLGYDKTLKAQLKELGGVDVIFDPVGGEVSEQVFRSLRPGGRHLVVGFASGKIPQISWNLPLLKSAAIIGVFWGHFWRNQPMQNRENIYQLIAWLSKGAINPYISKEFDLKDGKLALKQIMNREAKGKIILQP